VFQKFCSRATSKLEASYCAQHAAVAVVNATSRKHQNQFKIIIMIFILLKVPIAKNKRE
jgi:hypothetical protein